MKHRVLQIQSLILSLLFVVATPQLSAQALEGVSPGAVDRIDEVEGRCPTFIWSGVPAAATYELVVYRVPKEPQTSEASGIELSASDEVLFARVPGGATAWQPRLADGLEPGGSYVWFVRAVLREEHGEVFETSDWSAARFFAVSRAPSQLEIEQALEVLRRAAEPGGAGAATAAELNGRGDASSAADPARSSSGRVAAAPADLKSVPTAAAAVRGSSPDTTGEAYGVVGISSSPDGAGLAAANTGGGPDLVLDGSEDGAPDLMVSQAGAVKVSPGIESFIFNNPDVGELDVVVEGWTFSQQFVGGGSQLTGVDADALAGIDAADYATDAEATAMVAAHAASAAHDGRYYTKTQLNTSGGGGAVHWGNLTAVPAGFADGIDNEASFTAGPGIIIDNGEVRIDAAAFTTRLSFVDDLGSSGSHSSIAIGADGLGLISYFSESFHSLKVAHCIDVVCSGAVTSTLDNYGASGVNSAIAIGADGLGIISFYEGLQDDLKVAHCNDLTCSSATITTLDSTGNVGSGPSITIGADGLPLISYYNATAENLKIAHCNDVACSSATTPTLDSGGDVGQHSAIAIGADGLGLISYFDDTNNQIKVAHCTNVACSSADLAVLVSAGDVGSETSIAIGADGLGLISYLDNSTGELRVAHCRNAACTTAHIAIIDTVPGVGEHISLAIGADGFGLVSYIDQANFDLKLARCVDTDCSSATTTVIDGGVEHDGDTSIAIGVDGLGLITYQDYGHDLGIAHLGIGVP